MSDTQAYMSEIKAYKKKKDEEYTHEYVREAIRRYREECVGCGGGEEALSWYRKGLEAAQKSDEYDQLNYQYSYDLKGQHNRRYEKKGLAFFEEAAACYRRSAELGNELAMMNYAVYLYDFKGLEMEGLAWLLAASEKGLAVADYQLAVFHRLGMGGASADEAKAEEDYRRYLRRCTEDERQLILAWHVKDDGRPLSRFEMFSWFCGHSYTFLLDTPHATLSDWKFR